MRKKKQFMKNHPEAEDKAKAAYMRGSMLFLKKSNDVSKLKEITNNADANSRQRAMFYQQISFLISFFHFMYHCECIERFAKQSYEVAQPGRN
jgi:hypothetical protein